MTSVFLPVSPRKRSKNDLRQIEQQQQKISEMLRGLYERTRAKLTKSLTKCENRNTVLCRELFDSLTLHPQQELYETIRIHDLIFNEIDLVAETVAEFLRKMDVLHEKLRAELTLQQERNAVKRQKGCGGENSIAVLRKVSFKREKHALKHRLLALDTVNKKVLKCEAPHHESPQNGFLLDIQGKKSEPLVQAYSKIWFESKRREYLLCLTSYQTHPKFFILNDKLQTVAAFPHPAPALALPLTFLQLHNYIYLVAPHHLTRISLLNQSDIISKNVQKRILRAEVYSGGVVLWVVDRERQHSILFADENLVIYSQADLKLNVGSVPAHFTLGDSVFFLACSHAGQAEILKLEGCEAMPVGEVGSVEEVIPVRCGGKEQQEVIFRQAGNRFVKFSENGGLVGLEVEIEQGEAIKNCIVLGEHFYALSENGKSMLECHYQPAP